MSIIIDSNLDKLETNPRIWKFQTGIKVDSPRRMRPKKGESTLQIQLWKPFDELYQVDQHELAGLRSKHPMTLAVRCIVPVTVYSQFDELKFLFGILIKQLETKHFQFHQNFPDWIAQRSTETNSNFEFKVCFSVIRIRTLPIWKARLNREIFRLISSGRFLEIFY